MQKKTKRLVSLFVVGSLFTLLGATGTVLAAESILLEVQRTKTLKVGFSHYFPFAYYDEETKERVGVSVEIAELMAEALGAKKIDWHEVTMATFIAALQGRRTYFQPQITITPPRALVVEFSHVYARSPLGVVIQKKDAGKYTSIESLNKSGVKISVAMGTDNDLYGSRFFDKAEIVRVKSPPEALLALVSGRVDAHAAPLRQCRAVVEEYPKLSVVPGNYARTRGAIAVRQGDQIWLNWINQFVDDLEDGGIFDKIFEKYGVERFVTK